MANKPNKVILHCAATPDSRKSKFSVRDIRKWHKARGWRDIGYHYYITRDGKIHKGRKDSMQGAHTKGKNRNSLGVCYEGSYFPSMKQINSLIKLYTKIKNKYDIDIEKWYGHYQFANKDCPGFKMGDFKELIGQVNQEEITDRSEK